MASFWDTDGFWSDADTDDFADLVAEASPDTAIIARNMGTVGDGLGGQIGSFVNIGTLLVKVSAVGGGDPTEQVAGQQLQGISSVMLTVPTATNVRNGDRVTVNGQAYEVEGVVPGRSWEARRRVYAKAIGNQA